MSDRHLLGCRGLWSQMNRIATTATAAHITNDQNQTNTTGTRSMLSRNLPSGDEKSTSNVTARSTMTHASAGGKTKWSNRSANVRGPKVDRSPGSNSRPHSGHSPRSSPTSEYRHERHSIRTADRGMTGSSPRISVVYQFEQPHSPRRPTPICAFPTQSTPSPRFFRTRLHVFSQSCRFPQGGRVYYAALTSCCAVCMFRPLAPPDFVSLCLVRFWSFP